MVIDLSIAGNRQAVKVPTPDMWLVTYLIDSQYRHMQPHKQPRIWIVSIAKAIDGRKYQDTWNSKPVWDTEQLFFLSNNPLMLLQKGILIIFR